MDKQQLLPAAVMVLDLDGLKQINDSLGHQAGDLLLKTAAAIIRDAAPAESTVSRIGGDEFAILLTDADLSVVETIRQRIAARVLHYNADHPALPVGISAGIAVATSKPLSMRELFKQADANMYQDKKSRKQNAGKEAP